MPEAVGMPKGHAADHVDIFVVLERLAELRDKGMMADDGFVAKKAELLGRP